MKKFNILKSIVDFTWINLCLGFFVYTIFVVILLFNNNKEQKFNFEFYGVKIEEIGAYEKLLLVVLLIFIGIIIYVYYQFKALLRNFGRRKILISAFSSVDHFILVAS